MFAKSSSPNLFAEGQTLIIIARWVLIVLGLLLILADAQNVSFNVIRFEVVVILLLALSNFYLVTQVLTKKNSLHAAVYIASLFDIAVVTAIIIAQGGFESNAFTFYFPALLAFSLALPMGQLVTLVGVTISVYGLVGMFSLNSIDDLQVMVIRLMMLASIAFCGSYFADLEQKRYARMLQSEDLSPELGGAPADHPVSA